MRLPLLTTIGLLALGGCTPPPPSGPPVTVFPISQDEALARLAKADTAGFRDTMRCNAQVDIAAKPASHNAVTWQVSQGFAQITTFTVRLTAIDPKATHVDIDIPADPDGGEMYDGSHPITHPALRQPLRAAVAELLQSAFEQRSFNPGEIAGGIPSLQTCAGKAGATAPTPAPAPSPAQTPEPAPPPPPAPAPDPSQMGPPAAGQLLPVQ